jgi:hypothetical protein
VFLTTSVLPHNGLDSLIMRALAVSPTIMAARQRVDAVRAHVAPAGARLDLMVMGGIQNQPLGRETRTGWRSLGA